MRRFYARTSSTDQQLHRKFIHAEAMGAEKIYYEQLSGKDRNRPELQRMLNELEVGDTVCVESISRLARSTVDLLNIVGELNSKGVALVSQKEAFDTSTPQGKFVLTIFSALAELERATLLERQAEGIKSARLRGVHLGRKGQEIPREWWDLQPKVCRKEISKEALMLEMGINLNRYYYLLRRTKDMNVNMYEAEKQSV